MKNHTQLNATQPRTQNFKHTHKNTQTNHTTQTHKPHHTAKSFPPHHTTPPQDANQCDKCKVAKDGPFCVAQCPSSKYLDHSGHCTDCHNLCDDQGCSGPLPDQTENGCVSCKLPLLALPTSTQATCLPEESDCPPEYYRRHTNAVCGVC